LSIYDIVPNPEDLLMFDRKSKFSLPELTWVHNIGPTSIEFLNSDKLGKDYENDIFIGDFHNGNLYRLQLNMKRTDLLLGNPIADRVVQTDKENENIKFGEGFGSISDLEVGPDGYLYVISIGKGKIFRIIP
jgi:glucose/arabinose dehydrogenase